MAISDRKKSPQFEYQTLLEVSESIALYRDLTALFHDLLRRLPGIVRFDCVWFVLHNPEDDTMRLHTFVIDSPVPFQSASSAAVRSVDEAPSGLVWRTQEPLIVWNTDEEPRYPMQIASLKEMKIKSFCILPLTTAHRRLGAIGFGSIRTGTYGKAGLAFLGLVARQVALAVDNALSHEETDRVQHELSRERDRLRMLLDLNNTVVSKLDLRQLLRAVSTNVRRVMQCDYASIALPEPGGGQLRIYAREFSDAIVPRPEEILVPIDVSLAGEAFRTREPLLFDSSGLARFDPRITPFLATGLKSACFLPLVAHDRVLGTLNFGGRSDSSFGKDDLNFLKQVSGQVAIAVENALDYRLVSESRLQLAKEKLYLTEEIQTQYNSHEIIGESQSLKTVLEHVQTVASTSSTVLILGETGTGKELIARAIHESSSRRNRTFVRINCAAIPLGLLESELFGHEKGAFTGAIARRIGRFELANGGTLFLDEVGDIPLELQPKLLRVLQEQEFERLGSPQTRRVDVRMITATNQDLPAMIRERKFRSDLFYRINIFPITIPPLRERPGDVRLLIQYFIEKYSRLMHKRIEVIPEDAIDAMIRYRWPGNVRELQNFIERAVILTQSRTLRAPLSELQGASISVAPMRTLEQGEREQIIQALVQAGGVLGGPGGAAERLGLKRTTLFYKMRRLGIARPDLRQS